jgi:uncharacterized protein (DUF302 family)
METWQVPVLDISLKLKVSYQVLMESVIQGLKREGFAVVTEIDLQETLKRKLNVDTHPFKVLRVYHPKLTTLARTIIPVVTLLPYNLTITQLEGGDIELTFTDPLPAATIEEHAELIPIVSQAYRYLQRVANSLVEKS